MTDLIEKVSAALYAADEVCGGPNMARPAIAAVFDWLATPSEDALDAADGGPDFAWSAMLAELRKQALG